MSRIFLIGYLVLISLPLLFAESQEQEILSHDVQTGLHASIINQVQPYLVFDTQEKADAWLYDMSNRLKKWVPDESLRKNYLIQIQYEAMRAGLDPSLILSVITVESKFNKYAISIAGAVGLMQVMPFWQTQIGVSNHDLFDTKTNIRYGCTILRYYLKLESGNLNKALARYNGSINQDWYPELVMNTYMTYWQPYPVVQLSNGKIKYIDYTD